MSYYLAEWRQTYSPSILGFENYGADICCRVLYIGKVEKTKWGAELKLFSNKSAVSIAIIGVLLSSSSTIHAFAQDDGRTIVRAALAYAPRANFSPFTDDGPKLTQLGVSESLTVLDTAGTPQPALAVSWEQVEPSRWQFTLREGVTFQDGTPLDAAAVLVSLQAAAAASPVPRALSGYDYSFSAIDALTVEISTGDKVDPLVPQRFSSPFLAIYSSAAYAADGTVDVRNHGAGPFTLIETTGVETATLVAFDQYWGGQPAAAGLDIAFVPNGPARLASLQAGEVDIANTLPIAGLSGYTGKVSSFPLARSTLLYVNTASPRLSQLENRVALLDSVDSTAIANDLLEGNVDALTGLFGPALAWAAGEAPAAERPAEVLPSGALSFLTYVEKPELPEVAEIIADTLRQKGIEVDQRVAEYSVIEPTLLAGEFDLLLLSRSYGQDSGDPASFLRSDFRSDGSFNLSSLDDPELDALIDAADATVDIDARRAAIIGVADQVLADIAIIPVFGERSYIGSSENLSGLILDPFGARLFGLQTVLEK